MNVTKEKCSPARYARTISKVAIFLGKIRHCACLRKLVYENLGVTLYFFGLMLRFLLCCLPQLYILELPSALVRKQRCYYFDGGEAERGSWCQVSFPASAVSAVAAFLCTRKHQQTFPQTNQKVRTRFRLTWKSLFKKRDLSSYLDIFGSPWYLSWQVE